MLIAYGLLIVAVGMDFRCMRISNRLILIGLVYALIRRVLCDGISGLFTGLFLISFPVIILYLLFLVGALGAGDIKLFSLIGGFLNLKELIWCIVFAFLFAAVFSLIKMISYGRFFSGLKRALHYFCTLFQGNRKPYQPESLKKGRIHFSLSILLGLITTDVFVI